MSFDLPAFMAEVASSKIEHDAARNQNRTHQGPHAVMHAHIEAALRMVIRDNEAHGRLTSGTQALVLSALTLLERAKS